MAGPHSEHSSKRKRSPPVPSSLLEWWAGQFINLKMNFCNNELSEGEMFRWPPLALALKVHSLQVLAVALLSIGLLAFLILRYKRRWLQLTFGKKLDAVQRFAQSGNIFPEKKGNVCHQLHSLLPSPPMRAGLRPLDNWLLRSSSSPWLRNISTYFRATLCSSCGDVNL